MLLRVQFVGDHMRTLVHVQQSTVHKWHLEHYTIRMYIANCIFVSMN